MHLQLVLAFLFIASFFPARAQNDRQKMGFKGNVKTVRVVCYTATTSHGVATKKKRRYGGSPGGDSLVFNENGYLSGKTIYFSNDVYSRHYVYLYDDSNRVIGQQHYSAEGGIVGHRRSTDRFSYAYDSAGRVSERRYHRDSSDTVTRRTMYTYDPAGRLLASREMWPDGRVYESHTYRYNANGTPAEASESEDDNFLTTYRYDSLGRVSEKIIARSDRKNQLHYRYRYDTHGNVVEEQLDLGKKNAVRTYEYEYDQQGNIVRETIFVDGKAQTIRERIITYY